MVDNPTWLDTEQNPQNASHSCSSGKNNLKCVDSLLYIALAAIVWYLLCDVETDVVS